MKRFILKPVFLLVVLSTMFSANIRAQDLNSALLLTRSEQYDQAEKMLSQLIEKEPANSKYYYYLGENYLLEYYADTISNSLEIAAKKAQEVYEQGVEANPEEPLNYVGLAKVAYYLGDDKTADEMRTKAKSFLIPHKKIKKLQPPAPEYSYILARIAESYIKNNEVDTSLALPLIREAIRIDKQNRDVYLVAGDIFNLVDDGPNSIANYNQAQYVDPESPTAYMKIGKIYVRGKIYQAAISNFEQAININPEFAPAYRELGQLYSLARRYDESNTYFEKYLELTAGNIPAQTRYVNALFYAKDYEKVITNVEEIFSIDNSRTYLNRLAGYSYYEKDPPDYEKAQEYMETLFKSVDPERILWKDHYYMAKVLLGKHQDYVKNLDELTSLSDQLSNDNLKYEAASGSEKTKLKPAFDELNTKVSDLEGSIAEAEADIDRAFDEYNKVVEMKPEDTNIINEIAANNYNLRRYNEAAKAWAKLLDPSGDNNTARMIQIGKAYYTGGNLKVADSIFSEVVKTSPDNITAYVWIARTYSKMDPDFKNDLAKNKFNKVVEITQGDSVKNEAHLMEAFNYLSYYYMVNNRTNTAKAYFQRMINLNPDNNDNKIKGYTGIGSIDVQRAFDETTIEGRLAILSTAATSYNRVLSMDPANATAKKQLAYVREFEAKTREGINPNEIKGVIKDASSGQPLAFASVRVKDTAAENLTNRRGEFKFEIPKGSEVLLITAKGYQSKEVPITQTRTYNVNLDQE